MVAVGVARRKRMKRKKLKFKIGKIEISAVIEPEADLNEVLGIVTGMVIALGYRFEGELEPVTHD